MSVPPTPTPSTVTTGVLGKYLRAQGARWGVPVADDPSQHLFRQRMVLMTAPMLKIRAWEHK